MTAIERISLKSLYEATAVLKHEGEVYAEPGDILYLDRRSGSYRLAYDALSRVGEIRGASMEAGGYVEVHALPASLCGQELKSPFVVEVAKGYARVLPADEAATVKLDSKAPVKEPVVSFQEAIEEAGPDVDPVDAVAGLFEDGDALADTDPDGSKLGGDED